ncbi:MAG: hypothetical protein IH899_14740, partial [Planctomycetes bacterium]|nr:hypothetical protein [Planctomycetota bacterium]
TDILQVSYRGTQAKDCRIILTAVIESYQSFLGESARNISEETVRLISKAKDSLLTQLQRKEESYRRFRQESPLHWDNEKGNNIHQARLNQIEATRSQLLVQYSQTKAQLQVSVCQ